MRRDESRPGDQQPVERNGDLGKRARILGQDVGQDVGNGQQVDNGQDFDNTSPAASDDNTIVIDTVSPETARAGSRAVSRAASFPATPSLQLSVQALLPLNLQRTVPNIPVSLPTPFQNAPFPLFNPVPLTLRNLGPMSISPIMPGLRIPSLHQDQSPEPPHPAIQPPPPDTSESGTGPSRDEQQVEPKRRITDNVITQAQEQAQAQLQARMQAEVLVQAQQMAAQAQAAVQQQVMMQQQVQLAAQQQAMLAQASMQGQVAGMVMAQSMTACMAQNQGLGGSQPLQFAPQVSQPNVLPGQVSEPPDASQVPPGFPVPSTSVPNASAQLAQPAPATALPPGNGAPPNTPANAAPNASAQLAQPAPATALPPGHGAPPNTPQQVNQVTALTQGTPHHTSPVPAPRLPNEPVATGAQNVPQAVNLSQESPIHPTAGNKVTSTSSTGRDGSQDCHKTVTGEIEGGNRSTDQTRLDKNDDRVENLGQPAIPEDNTIPARAQDNGSSGRQRSVTSGAFSASTAAESCSKLLSGDLTELHPTPRYGTRGEGERQIVLARLTRRHEWIVTKTTDMSFMSYVLEDSERRPDMQRFFDCVTELSEQVSMRLWSHFVKTHQNWFKIPVTLTCSRTFARDEQEAVYLDWMDAFVSQKPTGFDITNIPLVRCRNACVNRWWNRPRNIVGLTKEVQWWSFFKVMVPFDSFDTPMSGSNVVKLNSLYPCRQEWWSLQFFPPIVPCPTPLVLFYYHLEWKNARSMEERAFWELTFELEHSLLYAACWWYEASRYGRAVVLQPATIEWLRERLKDDLHVDPEGPNPDFPEGKGPVTFKYIATRMYDAYQCNPEYHNTVWFCPPLDREFPECRFVYCQKYTGMIQGSTPRGRFLERNMGGDMYSA